MSETATLGHNSVAAGELRSYVERIERLTEEVKAINGDKRDIFAEAKAKGFDVKALREIIKRRAKDRDKLEDENNMVQVYAHALGEEWLV